MKLSGGGCCLSHITVQYSYTISQISIVSNCQNTYYREYNIWHDKVFNKHLTNGTPLFIIYMQTRGIHAINRITSSKRNNMQATEQNEKKTALYCCPCKVHMFSKQIKCDAGK